MTLVAISAVGLALGVFAAIAPIGPVTLMVLRRALQRDYGGAIATGLGRIPPEMVYVLSLIHI